MGNLKFKDSIPLLLVFTLIWMAVNLICAFSISSMVDNTILDSGEVFWLFFKISAIELTSLTSIGLLIMLITLITKKIKRKNNENKHSKYNR